MEKRAKVLENRVNGLKNEALAKKKAKDQRGTHYIYSCSLINHLPNLICIGALHAFKQAKMFEKELAKIDGMKTLLTQQKFMIESTSPYFIKLILPLSRQFLRQGCIRESGCRIKGCWVNEQKLGCGLVWRVEGQVRGTDGWYRREITVFY